MAGLFVHGVGFEVFQVAIGQRTFVSGGKDHLRRVAFVERFLPARSAKTPAVAFAQSGNSGQPVTGTPDSAGLGRVLSNSLELSNVDLGESFIDMIAAQRGFQANSRVITTSDEILQELVNLKR